jgi:hypothetical protein
VTAREELEQIRDEAKRGWLKDQDCPDCVRMSKALLKTMSLCEDAQNFVMLRSFANQILQAIEREMGHEGRAK